jgi:hypothetical protein
MAIQPRRKINKKEVLLIGAGIILMVFSLFLMVYSLTFLIKNINLILQTSNTQETETHFNLSGAKTLFPNIENSSTSTSTLP